MTNKTSKKFFRKLLKFSTTIFLMVVVAFFNLVAFLPQSFQDNKIVENFKVNEAQAAATFQAVGAQVKGTTEVNPVWPAHIVNDIGIMVVETGGEGTAITASGWTHIAGSPVTDVATIAGSKLNILWKRAASNAEATVATNDSGNHQIARIYTFRGVIETGNPWDVVATGIKTTASLTATAPSVTTTVANTLVLLIVGRPDDTNSVTHFQAFTNASLGTITERGEAGSNVGHGGGFILTTGTKAATGAIGTSVSTKAVSTTDTYMTIALIMQPTTILKAANSTLTSSIFDTGIAYGAAYNFIMWKGSFSGGATKVRFQFAASNASTGPWNYYGGSTCGALDWFDTTGPDATVELKCPTQFNNMRYFRYKVQLCSSSDCTTQSTFTPTITDVIVSWAP